VVAVAVAVVAAAELRAERLQPVVHLQQPVAAVVVALRAAAVVVAVAVVVWRLSQVR
jgi:hypothetical protein